MGSSLYVAKQQLRSLMKQRLSALPPEIVATQSHTVFEALQNFRPYQDAQRISIYLSMPSAEIQTDAIVRYALSQGKQVFVPYLHRSTLDIPDTPARVMDMVHLKSLQDYEGLARDRWGIPSIDPATVHDRQRILGGPDAHHSDKSFLDLMLVPGVAFDLDESGAVRRLGHGKGFYDYFLNRYFSRAEAHPDIPGDLKLFGLALTEQFLHEPSEGAVPTGIHDRRLDGLILGTGNIVGHTLDD